MTLTGHLHQSCQGFIIRGTNLQSRFRTSLLRYEVHRTKEFLFLPLLQLRKGYSSNAWNSLRKTLISLSEGRRNGNPELQAVECFSFMYLSLQLFGGVVSVSECVSVNVQHGGRERSCCSCLLCQLHGSLHCGNGRNWQQPEWSRKVSAINKSPTDKCSSEMLHLPSFFFLNPCFLINRVLIPYLQGM